MTKIFGTADILIIVRAETSEEPIKTLIELTPEACDIFIISPKMPIWLSDKHYEFLEGKALDGLPALVTRLLDDAMEDLDDDDDHGAGFWSEDDDDSDDGDIGAGEEEDIWGAATEDAEEESPW
jgi:hypothetical protein